MINRIPKLNDDKKEMFLSSSVEKGCTLSLKFTVDSSKIMLSGTESLCIEFGFSTIF